MTVFIICFVLLGLASFSVGYGSAAYCHHRSRRKLARAWAAAPTSSRQENP